MKMTYDDQVVQITFNTFSREEYLEIKLLLEIISKQSQKKSTKENWPDSLHSETKGYFDTCTIYDEDLRSIIIDRCIDLYGTISDETLYNIIYHESQGESSINWHEDGDDLYSGAVTFYFNDAWNLDFGGYFIYQKDNDKVMTSIQPVGNTSLYVQRGVLHAVTPIRYDAPSRKSIQVFIRHNE